MKVLLISRTFYPEGFGGGEMSALHIARALSKDIDVVVCCLSEKIKYPKVENFGKVKVYRYPWKKLKFSKKLSNLDYAYSQIIRATKDVIDKESPTHLHFLNFQSIFPIARKFNKYPKFATINGPLFCEFGSLHPDGKKCYNCTSKERFILSFKKWGLKGFFFWLYNRYSQNLQKSSLKKCDKLFAVSNAIKDMLISGGIDKDKIEVIYNPISIKKHSNTELKEKLGISKNKKIILYSGRLSKDKGIHNTIEAIKNLNNIVFLIAGKKRDYYNELKELVEKLNLERRVIFLGFIDNDVVQEYFSISDLVVHPCAFYEPLSRMLLEATAHGLPIIASRIGGNPEIVENNINGFLVLNKKELREKIELLTTNNKLAQDMGKNSQEVISKRFAPEKISKKIIEEYKKIK